MTMAKSGREFEEAVWAFVQTLDPSAEVLFNHSVPDRDTGTPRQCDVWINARFGGHFPISILVSCKDHKRKINVSDIGAFHDEVRSTGASTGVLYSTSPFTIPALKKAQVNGLACCRLYQNEPADVPAVLQVEAFASSPRIILELIFPETDPELKTWNDIFDIRFIDTNNLMLDKIVEIFHQHEHKSVEEAKGTGQFPNGWSLDVEFNNPSGDKLVLRLQCTWRKFKGKIEASLINGSYCFTNGSFRGIQTTPVIDTQSEHPGDQWVEITDKDTYPPENRLISILYHGDVSRALREKLGTKPLRLQI